MHEVGEAELLAASARGAFMQWLLNAATLLGWLLSSIFALSLARLSRGT